MIYDIIDIKKIGLGKEKKFSNENDKKITPVFYDNGVLEFTLKNKYVSIKGIKENIYNKDFIEVKSKKFAEIIELISEKLETVSPVYSDGIFRAIINDKTKINKDISELKLNNFDACISLVFPTIYSDETKKTLQVYVKDIVVTKVYKDDLDIDFDKLELAM